MFWNFHIKSNQKINIFETNVDPGGPVVIILATGSDIRGVQTMGGSPGDVSENPVM